MLDAFSNTYILATKAFNWVSSTAPCKTPPMVVVLNMAAAEVINPRSDATRDEHTEYVRESTTCLDSTLSSANRESASRKAKIRELEKELEIEKE